MEDYEFRKCILVNQQADTNIKKLAEKLGVTQSKAVTYAVAQYLKKYLEWESEVYDQHSHCEDHRWMTNS